MDGFPVRNPASLIRRGASIRLRDEHPLRGEAKLGAALATFGVSVAGRVALDVGAAAGGFTRALLARGARLVYAVDAGHGQLAGSLRVDPRVVDLEATNLGELDRHLVPDAIGLVAIDVSYVALAVAVPQLARVELAAGAELVALVKPQFELALAQPPTDRAGLAEALDRATVGIEAAGWSVRGRVESPVRGARGAVEYFVYAELRRASRS